LSPPCLHHSSLHAPQDGSINDGAVNGALGAFSALEIPNSTSPEYQSYVQQWSASQGGACNEYDEITALDAQPYCACDGQCICARTAPYCDADEDPTSMTSHAARDVDAVLLFVQAVQSLHSISGLYNHTASEIYSTIKSLAPPQGFSSVKIHLDVSGDRLGLISVVNLQWSSALSRARRLDLRVPLTSFVSMVTVGSYGAATRLLRWNAEDVVFASGGSVPPPDVIRALGCASGHIRIVDALTGLQECRQCSVGTYEVERSLCNPAPSDSYVPMAGQNATGVVACPPGTRNVRIAFSPITGSPTLLDQTGGSSAANCVVPDHR
jgi:hypothetical protein